MGTGEATGSRCSRGGGGEAAHRGACPDKKKVGTVTGGGAKCAIQGGCVQLLSPSFTIKQQAVWVQSFLEEQLVQGGG